MRLLYYFLCFGLGISLLGCLPSYRIPWDPQELGRPCMPYQDIFTQTDSTRFDVADLSQEPEEMRKFMLGSVLQVTQQRLIRSHFSFNELLLCLQTEKQKILQAFTSAYLLYSEAGRLLAMLYQRYRMTLDQAERLRDSFAHELETFRMLIHAFDTTLLPSNNRHPTGLPDNESPCMLEFTSWINQTVEEKIIERFTNFEWCFQLFDASVVRVVEDVEQQIGFTQLPEVTQHLERD